MTITDLPVVRLKPKINAQPIRFGAPWVYDDMLVLDRRTRALAPGSIVTLEDAERRPLGLGAFNAHSKIIVRLLERDTAASVDQNWLEAKLTRALSLREQLYDAPFYRLVHAEADGLPGVIIDRFGDVAVIQPNAAWADVMLDSLVAALTSVVGVTTIYKNASGRARGLEGLDEHSTILSGQVDGALDVPMNGAVFRADILGGQKTGIFFDQRPNHAFAARLAEGRDVLDVFSHVGGFGLTALANGATDTLAVDGSATALALAEEGAARSGLAEHFSTRRGDAFDVMGELAAEGRKFGVVICDPPAFAPSKQALEAGLRAYERVARLSSALVAPGGMLTLCSCSHAADLSKFRSSCLRGVGKAGRQAQILHVGAAGPDHPVHPALAETSYLKALFLRLD